MSRKWNPWLAAVLLGLSWGSAPAGATQAAQEDPGFYAGVFGGLGAALGTSLRQRGTVYLPHPLPNLPIDANGSTGSSTRVGVGGIQFGHEWGRLSTGTRWGLRPAAELEAIY